MRNSIMKNFTKMGRGFCIVAILSLVVLVPLICFGADTGGGGTGSATDNNSITYGLCVGIKIVTGGTGQALAIIAIIIVAIGLFLGKLSWGVAIAIGIGMGLLFGAPQIVSLFSGQGALKCDNITKPS